LIPCFLLLFLSCFYIIMAAHEWNSLQPALLHGEPPTGAAVDGAHSIAGLAPRNELDAVDSPISDSSDNTDRKMESAVGAPQRSKGKIALIMSALCVSSWLCDAKCLWHAEIYIPS
jgi:hypothetical protein